jgi:hypothetical protein
MANGAEWFNVNGARTINNLALPKKTINTKFLEERKKLLTLNQKS